MDASLLSLLVLLSSLDFVSPRVTVTVEPRTSQFFKYDSFSVTCDDDEQVEEEATGWTVMKRMQDGEIHPCPSSCSIIAAFPATDSGAYWCEHGSGETSCRVNITVTAGPVILESPAHPVTEGSGATLTCRQRHTDSSGDLTAHFYKDSVYTLTRSTGVLSLHNISTSHEGLYWCEVDGLGKSPPSWLSIAVLPPAGQDPTVSLMPVSLLLRHLVVGTPYLLSTILLGLMYRDRARVQRARKARPTTNDVVMEIAT